MTKEQLPCKSIIRVRSDLIESEKRGRLDYQTEYIRDPLEMQSEKYVTIKEAISATRHKANNKSYIVANQRSSGEDLSEIRPNKRKAKPPMKLNKKSNNIRNNGTSGEELFTVQPKRHTIKKDTESIVKTLLTENGILNVVENKESLSKEQDKLTENGNKSKKSQTKQNDRLNEINKSNVIESIEAAHEDQVEAEQGKQMIIKIKKPLTIINSTASEVVKANTITGKGRSGVPVEEKDENDKEYEIKEHSENEIPCEICSNTFPNNFLYAAHRKIHSSDGRYVCHICSDFATISKYRLKLHIEYHEGKIHQRCNICNKTFLSRTELRAHKNTHLEDKPFECDACNKKFVTFNAVYHHRRRVHLDTVEGKKIIRYCDICKKNFSTASSLKRHKSTQHSKEDANVVLCDICGRALKGKQKLEFHRRTHTGYKPYACRFCPKCFASKVCLTDHERVHTGEKPYTCKYCERKFTQRTTLKVHERTHTGEKPFICCWCRKGFIASGAMNTHMKNCNGIEDKDTESLS